MTRVDPQVRSADTVPAPADTVPGEGEGAHRTHPPAGQTRVRGYPRLTVVNRGERWDDVVNAEHTSNDVAHTSATTSQTHAAHVAVTGTGWPLGQTRR
jgi:hypothetical protein